MDSSDVASTSSAPAKSSVGDGDGCGLGDGESEGDGDGEGDGSTPDDVPDEDRRRVVPDPEPLVLEELGGGGGWTARPEDPGLPCSEVPGSPGSSVPSEVTSGPSLPSSPGSTVESSPGISPPCESSLSVGPQSSGFSPQKSTASAEGAMGIRRATSAANMANRSRRIVS